MDLSEMLTEVANDQGWNDTTALTVVLTFLQAEQAQDVGVAKRFMHYLQLVKSEEQAMNTADQNFLDRQAVGNEYDSDNECDEIDPDDDDDDDDDDFEADDDGFEDDDDDDCEDEGD